MSRIECQAPAKINLFLHILGRRADGYHDLSMLMEKISLWDALTLEKTPKGIELICDLPGVPAEKNIVYQAAEALQKISGSKEGVRIHLIKKIPTGAGLGGGSSDAAAVLKNLNVLWDLGLSNQKLIEIGVKLGADVPFFIENGPFLVKGIGEGLTPLVQKLPKLWILLIYPGVGVATSWAYAEWDRSKCQAPTAKPLQLEPGTYCHRLTRAGAGATTRPSSKEGGRHPFQDRTGSHASVTEVLSVLENDFEEVVFPSFPPIVTAKKILVEHGAKGALMSGSGSAVFGLFETKEARDVAFEKVPRKEGWQIFAAENF